MIPPVNGVHGVDDRPVEVQPAAEVKPDPRAQGRPVEKSGEVSQDQVTLRSAGRGKDNLGFAIAECRLQISDY